MSLAIRYMVCLPFGAMPRFQVPIRPRLCRDFRELMSIGRAIHACSNATRVMSTAVKKCPLIYGRRMRKGEFTFNQSCDMTGARRRIAGYALALCWRKRSSLSRRVRQQALAAGILIYHGSAAPLLKQLFCPYLRRRLRSGYYACGRKCWRMTVINGFSSRAGLTRRLALVFVMLSFRGIVLI